MVKYVSPNFIKASNLILIAAGLVVVNYLLLGTFTAFFELAVVSFTVVLQFVMALLIRQGFSWAKWVYVIITVLSLFTTVFNSIPFLFKLNPLAGCIAVLETILYIGAAVLLFIPSKQPLINSSTESTII